MARGFFAGLIDRVVKKAAKAPPAPRRGPHEVDPNVPPGVRITPRAKPRAIPQDIILGRSEVPDERRTNVPVPPDVNPILIPAYIAGTMTYVTSSVISALKYDKAAQELTVFFLKQRPDGRPLTLQDTVYEGVTEDEAVEFYRAASKGGAWHDLLLGIGWTPGGGTVKSWHFL